MTIDELEVVCQEAARNLVERSSGLVPATVVLPLPNKTQVSSLADWPDDEDARLHLLERFAADVMRPSNAPCYGFVAEGVANDDSGAPVDVLVVTVGARGNHPRVAAAVLAAGELGEFTPSEPLAPAAMPFLVPLQRAADGAGPPDAFSG